MGRAGEPFDDRESASRPAIRLAISRAALFVNVTAMISPGGMPSSPSRKATRYVRTRVFPDPGPASTRTGPGVMLTAWRWCGLRSSSDDIELRPVRFDVERPGRRQQPAQRLCREGHDTAVGKVRELEMHRIAGGFAGYGHEPGRKRLVEAQRDRPDID